MLHEQPLKTYAEGRELKVPFMLGNTLREGFIEMPLATLRETIRLQYRTLAPLVLEVYGLIGPKAPEPDPVYGDAAVQFGTDRAHRCRVWLTGLQHTTAGASFYQFQFSRDLPGQTNASTHTDEIPFVFGTPALSVIHLTSPAETKLSDQMQSYWTNFAKTGDPNGPGLPHWAKFDAKSKAYMSFPTSGAAAGEGLRADQCELFLQAEKTSPSWQSLERAEP